MKLLILINLISLFNNPIWGQRASIYGDTISAETARKHIKEGKLYFLVYGELASIPYEECEEKVWKKYSCEVVHVSNYGVPEADTYNQVLFSHLDSIYNTDWQSEKDSILEDCLTNNICGINANEWMYSNRGEFPKIVFENNQYELTELARCLLDDFFAPILNEVQKDSSITIGIYATTEENELIENLAFKRCNSVKSYLISLGISREQLIIEGRSERLFQDEQVAESDKQRRWISKWNRVAYISLY